MKRPNTALLYKTILVIIITSIALSSSFCQISIIGTATPAGEYDTDYNLIQDLNNPSIWTGQLRLKENAFFKFRANNDWTENWGATTFPTGTLIFDGADVFVDSTATYQMTFDSTALTYEFVPIPVPTMILTQNGQVGIGVISPSPSAIVEIQSNSQGLLPPRMLKEERDLINDPEAGLMLWCSDCGDNGETQVFNGVKWTNLIGGFASTTTFPSVQEGMDIDGETVGEYSGYSTSISADGTRLAIGAPRNSESGSFRGQVRIYDWDGNTWAQIGSDINGEAGGDQSGFSVSLSADGTRVAIGAPYNDGAGTNSGHVRIFEWDGSGWIQVGGEIDGEAGGDESGITVSLSADGTRVAIGAPYNDGNGTDSGHVRIFEWGTIAWAQVGGDIDGEASIDLSGRSVSLSADGTKVAIGAYLNDGNGGSSGHVRVYDWSGNTWDLLGSDIDGEAIDDQSGWSVSLSADGLRLAVGAFGNDENGFSSGHTRIYDWDGNTWVQVGEDIDGEESNDQSGRSVSLSADGTRIAIGAYTNDGNGSDSGHVRLFEWDVNKWEQLGSDINGEAIDDLSGWSVFLSADGLRLAVGAYGNDGNGGSSGHVKVYK